MIFYDLAPQVNTAKVPELFLVSVSVFIGHPADSQPGENRDH